MIVIQTKEFHRLYCKHVEAGSLHGKMAQRAATVITNLTHGLPPGVATTNNGENRLRNCVKYALNDSFRLVTVQQGGHCFVLYMGIHDSCDQWLVQHRNMQVVLNPKDQTVALVAAVQDATSADLTPSPIGASETPFLSQVTGVDWTDIISSPSIRCILLQLKESDGDKVWEIIAAVQQENRKLADLLVTVINHLRRNQPTEARLAVDAYLGNAIADTTEKPLEPQAVEEALRQPPNSDRFVVLNDLPKEQLDLVLDPLKFQEWMIFLHEGQKRVVNEDFDRPAILTGVSGSGKTCVLVHRANRLAEAYADGRVLMLTLNRSLARLIENLITRVCSPAAKARIDVLSFHDFLANLVASLDLDSFLETLGKCTSHTEAVEALLRRLPPQQLRQLFQAIDEGELFQKFTDFLNDATHTGSDDAVRLWSFLSTSDFNADPIQYLYEEMELVRSAFPSLDRYSGYLEDYERPGRSIALQRNRREQVLRLLHAWEHHQIQSGFLDHMGLSQAVAVAVEDRGMLPNIFTYRCVLVDEFQDFSTLDLITLQKIPQSNLNGLFLTGDLAQKIYAKELNFPKAGLGPDQRTLRSIRKNYRNSKQILLAADSLIKAFPPAMDGDADLSVLDPEFASRPSARPIALKTEDPIREAWRQAKEWLAEGNPGFSLCIATANPDQIAVADILAKAPKNIVAVKLSGDYLLNPTHVVVSDMTAIKGFEFSLIMIVGLEDRVFPYEKRPEAEVWRDAMRLYVAITRGRDEVRFPYRNDPSRFLVAMKDHLDWREGSPFPESEAEVKDNAPAKSPMPRQQASNDEAVQHKVLLLNGQPCLSIPHGVSQRQLASILNASLTELAVNMQQYESHFVPPNVPLPDHIVRNTLERWRVLVNFLDRQSPLMPTLP